MMRGSAPWFAHQAVDADALRRDVDAVIDQSL
jgi:hypothetical protein